MSTGLPRTFLFTDIEGSSDRWRTFPEAMPAALERHNALIRAAVEREGGRVFKTVGDEVCAVFDAPERALLAAIEAQRTLHAEDWSRFGARFPGFAVRMALHTGRARPDGDDFQGASVAVAARIMSAANGGQIFCSHATTKRMGTSLPAGVAFHDHGEHRIRASEPVVRLVEVVVAWLPAIQRPPRTDTSQHADRTFLRHTADRAPDREQGVGDAMDALLRDLRGRDGRSTLSPSEARAIARLSPSTLLEYRLGRIADWSLPRYQLDTGFVALSLLVDRGREAIAGRWQIEERRYGSLADVLDARDEPAMIVLGPPGSGKSTLLRHLDLELARRAVTGDEVRVGYFVQLNLYGEPGQAPPPPDGWLAARWAARLPDLPSLHELLAEGRMVLLLDGLNEMPGTGAELDALIAVWRRWLHHLVDELPGNRVVFSCRSLDYATPLSTPELPVLQVRIEPLSDDGIRTFLERRSPRHGSAVWARLAGSAQLEVLRSPYFLQLLVDQIEVTGAFPDGRAALITGFVRQALKRELERGMRLFEDVGLLTDRDRRRSTQERWRDAWHLPDEGRLFDRFSDLAYDMQAYGGASDGAQVRIPRVEAVQRLNDPLAERILDAGAAIGILDEDALSEDVAFVHQLVQEYFAARRLARAPRPVLARAPWRADRVRRPLARLVADLAPADPLPGLPTTGWEETTALAAAMAVDPIALLRGLMPENLALAGRCAAQPELQPRLPHALQEELRWALVARSRDPAADVRARIAAGEALGALGDPRFAPHEGPFGPYLLPPMAPIPAGRYPIGSDEGIFPEEAPAHLVDVGGFEIGVFPVTNAEFRCFIAAGGYDDERWWDTEDAREWRLGGSAASDNLQHVRVQLMELRAQPGLLDLYRERGVAEDDVFDFWHALLLVPDAELPAAIAARRVPRSDGGRSGHRTIPAARMTHPVNRVSWYEAQAYAQWLSAQSGMPFALPSEAMWEAAARGRDGRRYPYGDAFRAEAANTVEMHVRDTTPVGVFPDGDTPEGVCDLCGNVLEWTRSLYGARVEEPDFPYPYRADDGREDVAASAQVMRIARGGGWTYGADEGRACTRVYGYPVARTELDGFRLALDVSWHRGRAV